MHTPVVPPPSRDLLLKVKASFIARDTTLAAWCRENGYQQSNVREALMGTWNGPKGRALRARLCQEAGITAAPQNGRRAA